METTAIGGTSGSVLVRRPPPAGQTHPHRHSWAGLQGPRNRTIVELSAWEDVLRAVESGNYEVAVLELDEGARGDEAARCVRLVRRVDADIHVFVVADQDEAIQAALGAGALDAVASSEASRALIHRLIRLADERNRTAEQLAHVARVRRMEGLSGTVLSSLPHAVLAVGPEGDIAFANHAAGELSGVPLSSLGGRSFTSLLDVDHRWRVGQALDRNRAGHRVYGIECRLRSEDDRNAGAWVQLDFAPWHSSSKGERGSLVVGRMLTEHRQFSGPDESSGISPVIDAMPVGIVVADGRGTPTMVNRTARAMLGSHAHANLGRWETLGLFRSPDGLPAKPHELPFARTLRDGLPRREIELIVDVAGADGVPVLVNTDAVRGAEGEVTEVCISLTNLSERRRVEGQLIQAQKMESLGLLAGTVAHDFKNVLCAVLGYAELLTHQLDAASPLARFANEIHKAGEQGTALARQLMVFTREDGFNPVPLDPAASFRDCLGVIERMIPEDIRLAIHVAQDAGTIQGDANRLWQVLMNLVLNARDAMPQGGTIAIRLDKLHVSRRVPGGPAAGDYAYLEVSDDGCGMSDEVRAHIFEPFFTTKAQGAGTGLGLSVVRSVLRQHKATVDVASTPNEGTTFRMWFPLVDARPERSAPPRLLADATPPLRRNVLLAEDDPMVRAVLREVLEVSGCQVIEAASAEDALEKAAAVDYEIHALLTDVVMPGMNGRELAERLRQHVADLRVLYLSGYTEEALRRHGVRPTEMPFLQKPFNPSTLSSRVHDLFGSEADRELPGSRLGA